MPIINDRIHTKVLGVSSRQAVLRTMYEDPHLIDDIVVDPCGKVLATFHEGPTIHLGSIHPKYNDFLKTTVRVLSWRITGGFPLHGVPPRAGRDLLSYYGLNIEAPINGPERKSTQAPGQRPSDHTQGVPGKVLELASARER